MQERMTLSNMSAELGAQAGLIAPDETTAAFLAPAAPPPVAIAPAFSDHHTPTTAPPAPLLAAAAAPPVDIAPWFTDEDAERTRHRFDASTLEPHIAAPHSPANSHSVRRYAGMPVDVAYIGACTGAKLDDLRAAARVLRGHKAAAGTRLIVAPASLRDQEQARAEGVLQVLIDAGAELLPTACGACSGYGAPMGDGITVISTTARNFKGRMGTPSAQVYLGSPYTVAAAALRGHVTDPREVLA